MFVIISSPIKPHIIQRYYSLNSKYIFNMKKNVLKKKYGLKVYFTKQLRG
jgi:hypothetical protein